MRCTKYFRILTLSAFIAVGLSGCNLFNPFEKENVDENDADALIYEGYQNIRNTEYTKAAERFSKAIQADSTKSDAWFGLAKAVLNQYELNVFEMLKYANMENDQSGFLAMDDASATKYRIAIDTVLNILDQFIARDTSGMTDQRIRFTNFTTSYTVLQFANVAILIRDVKSDMSELFDTDASGKVSMDWSKLATMADTSAVSAINALASSAKAVQADPSNTYPIIRNFVPSADTLSDDELEEKALSIADQFIEMSDIVMENEDRSDVFIKIGNGIDDDGDGCIDEEVWDGEDNDGDGEIDEDMRDAKTLVFALDWKNRTIESLKKPAGSIYETLDIDGNGIGAEDSEWNFIYPIPEERQTNNDHRLLFAINLTFVEGPNGDKIYNKDLVRMDTDVNNIKYDLDWRKANVGGCWVNYTEADFLKWFEGRN